MLQAIGQLAQRSTQIFQSDISIAQRLFGSLSTEPPGTRATLQEAVSTLAVAYKVLPLSGGTCPCRSRSLPRNVKMCNRDRNDDDVNCPFSFGDVQGSTGETAEAIQELLLESIKSSKEPTRLCAVQWAVK